MRRFYLVLCFAAAVLVARAGEPLPLRRAHAHNDYEHAHPLADALDQGFCSVEADVYLVNGQLLVAHDRKNCHPDRTLESLYLQPLQKRVLQNGGVYPGVANFSLWLDVKIDPANTKGGKKNEASEDTCREINKVLERYAGMLTQFSEQGTKTNAVTVILTGAHSRVNPTGTLHVCYDSHPGEPSSDTQKFALALSENWTHLFHWDGNSTMPAEEKRRLRDLVGQAHAQGKGVRFWATPEKASVWKELAEAQVDWIGTDHLKELAEFLHMQDKRPLATK